MKKKVQTKTGPKLKTKAKVKVPTTTSSIRIKVLIGLLCASIIFAVYAWSFAFLPVKVPFPPVHNDISGATQVQPGSTLQSNSQLLAATQQLEKQIYPDCPQNSIDVAWQQGFLSVGVIAQNVDVANVKLYKTDAQTMKKNEVLGGMARCELVSEEKLGSKPILNGKFKIIFPSLSDLHEGNLQIGGIALNGIQKPGIYYVALSFDGDGAYNSGIFLNVTDSAQNYAHRYIAPSYKLQHFVSRKSGFSFDYPASSFDPSTNKQVSLQVYERDHQVVLARKGLKSEADFALEDHGIPESKGMSFLKNYPSWVMNVATDVKTEADLQKVVKSRYGDACSYSYYSVPIGKDVIRVDQISDGLSPDQNTQCWGNWQYYFYWNRAAGVAVYWDDGQEPQFWLSQNSNSGSYDETMAESFRFN